MTIKRLAALCLAVLTGLALFVTVHAEESGETSTVESIVESVVESATESASEPASEPVTDSAPEQSTDVGGSADSGEPAPTYDFTVSYGYEPLMTSDGTHASDYVKGKAPATAYVKAGDSHVVAKCGYSFRDYVFAGWKYGSKIYQPGDIIYNIQGNMTLLVTWRRPERPSMTVVGVLGYEGAGSVHVEVGKTVTLKAGLWQESDGRIFEGGSAFLMSFGVASFKPYGGSDSLVSVSYDCGVSSGVQCAFKVASGDGFRVDNCFGKRDGFKFVGYKDQNGKVYQAGDTCIATGDMVFTAQWQEESKPAPDYCSVTLLPGEGGRFSIEGKTTVPKGEKIEFTVIPDEGYELMGVTCDGEELGTGGTYILTVNADMVIKADFLYVKVEEPSSEESSEESLVESVEESVSTSSEAEEESTVPQSSSADVDEEDGGGKGGLLVVAILVCVICLCAVVWYISKAAGGKKR